MFSWIITLILALIAAVTPQGPNYGPQLVLDLKTITIPVTPPPAPIPPPEVVAAAEVSIIPLVETPPPSTAAIRAYLRGLPIEAVADTMIREAAAVGVDWRLAPVIGMLESTGGLYACGFNAWGYASPSSCTDMFTSFDDGARAIIHALAAPPYAGLSTQGKLCMWVAGGASWCAGYVNRATHEMGVLTTLSSPATLSSD